MTRILFSRRDSWKIHTFDLHRLCYQPDGKVLGKKREGYLFLEEKQVGHTRLEEDIPVARASRASSMMFRMYRVMRYSVVECVQSLNLN